MQDSELYFNKCFSPGWLEDTKIPETTPLENSYQPNFKSKETLENELAEIKDHLQDVRRREWNLAEKIKFFNAGIAEN